MVKGLFLQNFRSIKSFTFDFNAITILTGANNSGKSSIIKALLLLEDNYKKNHLEEIDFSGGRHDLGSFDLVRRHGSDQKEMMMLEVICDNYKLYNPHNRPDTLGFFPVKLHFRLGLVRKNEKGRIITLELLDSSPDVTGEKRELFGVFVDNKPNPKKRSLKEMRIQIRFNWRFFLHRIETYLKEHEEKESRELNLPYEEELQTIPPLDDGFFPKEILGLSQTIIDDAKISKATGSKTSKEIIKTLNSVVLDYLQSYDYNESNWFRDFVPSKPYSDITAIDALKTYLPGLHKGFLELTESHEGILERKIKDFLKELLKKHPIEMVVPYNIIKPLANKIGHMNLLDIFTDPFLEFRKLLRKKVEDLLVQMGNSLSFEYLPSIRAYQRRIYLDTQQGSALDELLSYIKNHHFQKHELGFINDWVEKFDIADGVEFKRIEGIGSQLFLLKNDKRQSLTEQGTGIAQVLPIILTIALKFTSKNADTITEASKLLIIEEPETNLHPKSQSLLADLFKDAYEKYNIHFIIETHSEYLIRKLQYLVGTDKIEHDRIGIYYFNSPESKEKNLIRRIKINKDGTLDGEFGTGFFDEADNLALAIYRNASSSKN